MKLTAERILEETMRNEYLSDTLKQFDMFPEDKDARENSIEILESKIAKAEAEIKKLQEEVSTYREALTILKYVSKKYKFRAPDPNTRDFEEPEESEAPKEQGGLFSPMRGFGAAMAAKGTQNPVTENCKSLISELKTAYVASCAEHKSVSQALLLDWGMSEEAFLERYTKLLEQEG